MPAHWILGPGTGNPYVDFTDACNAQMPVVILSSGQACVWYRLTLASKDGDWLVREDDEALAVVRAQLARLGARYRLGAPLDVRWLRAGWSSHAEALSPDGLRLRFDFVSRPPRLGPDRLATLWSEVGAGAAAVVSRRDLVLLKQTMRLKDYAFIGSLATQLQDPTDQLRWTLDARHLLDLLQRHPHLKSRLDELRPACAGVETLSATAERIDAEVRQLRAADEARIQTYAAAQEPWAARFRQEGFGQRPLEQEHVLVCAAVEGALPMQVVFP